MIRVATLLKQMRTGRREHLARRTDDRAAADAIVRERALAMLDRAGRVLGATTTPGARRPRHPLPRADRTTPTRSPATCATYFAREICAGAHAARLRSRAIRFPYISNLSKNLAVVVKHDGRTQVRAREAAGRSAAVHRSCRRGWPIGRDRRSCSSRTSSAPTCRRSFRARRSRARTSSAIIRDTDIVIQEDEARRSARDDRPGPAPAAPRRARRCCRSSSAMPRRVLDILVENFEIDEGVRRAHDGSTGLRRLDGADAACTGRS